MRGCRSCFEPRHSTGTSEIAPSLGSQPEDGRAFSRPPRRHPRRYEHTAARALDPLSGHSVRASRCGGRCGRGCRAHAVGPWPIVRISLHRLGHRSHVGTRCMRGDHDAGSTVTFTSPVYGYSISHPAVGRGRRGPDTSEGEHLDVVRRDRHLRQDASVRVSTMHCPASSSPPNRYRMTSPSRNGHLRWSTRSRS